jgi:hypothetical protein
MKVRSFLEPLCGVVCAEMFNLAVNRRATVTASVLELSVYHILCPWQGYGEWIVTEMGGDALQTLAVKTLTWASQKLFVVKPQPRSSLIR